MVNEEMLGAVLLGSVGYLAFSGAIGGKQEEENNNQMFGGGGGGFLSDGFLNLGNNLGNLDASHGAPHPSETQSKKESASGIKPPQIVIRESNDLGFDFQNITEQIQTSKKQKELDRYSNLTTQEEKGFLSGNLSSSDIKTISTQRTSSKKQQKSKDASSLLNISQADFTKKYGQTKAEARSELGIPQPTISKAPERSFFGGVRDNVVNIIKNPSTIGSWFRGL